MYCCTHNLELRVDCGCERMWTGSSEPRGPDYLTTSTLPSRCDIVITCNRRCVRTNATTKENSPSGGDIRARQRDARKPPVLKTARHGRWSNDGARDGGAGLTRGMCETVERRQPATTRHDGMCRCVAVWAAVGLDGRHTYRTVRAVHTSRAGGPCPPAPAAVRRCVSVIVQLFIKPARPTDARPLSWL